MAWRGQGWGQGGGIGGYGDTVEGTGLWAQGQRDRDGDEGVGLGAMGTRNGGDRVVGTEGQRGQGWGQGGGIGGYGDTEWREWGCGHRDKGAGMGTRWDLGGMEMGMEGMGLWAQGDKGTGMGRKPRWGTRGRM